MGGVGEDEGGRRAGGCTKKKTRNKKKQKIEMFYFTGLPHWNIWAAIIFIVAAVTDWLDGFLARKNNQVSNFGKLWDPIADKLLVLAALLLLMDWGKVGFIAVLILEARELLIGGMRSVAASKGVVIAADKSGGAVYCDHLADAQ